MRLWRRHRGECSTREEPRNAKRGSEATYCGCLLRSARADSCDLLLPVFKISVCGLLGQRAMDKRNRDRSFSDCRCHAFDVAAPNVTHGEHARK